MDAGFVGPLAILGGGSGFRVQGLGFRVEGEVAVLRKV